MYMYMQWNFSKPESSRNRTEPCVAIGPNFFSYLFYNKKNLWKPEHLQTENWTTN